MSDEAAIESKLQAKGLNAPRLTPALIDHAIVDQAFHVFPGTTLTVCALTLRNGFMVTGESRPASDANFDEELGRKIAYAQAREKIWALEGYLLREKLAQAGTVALDARLDDVEALAERVGLFNTDSEEHRSLARADDQALRQWAMERALGHIGPSSAEPVVAFAEKLVAFAQGVRTIKAND